MRDVGIEDATFHTLRHTAAAWMVQDGVSLYEVQHVLGHSTPMMTQRYAHLQPGHLRRAVGALDKKLRK
jgi:integrase